MSFSTTYVEKRAVKNRFFNQINIIINRKSIYNIINKHYTVGTSATGTPSTDGLLLFNKRVSTFRYTVERTFGSIQKWFGAGIARDVGLAKTNTQHLLESICYNLKRAPRLIIETEIRKQQTQQIGYQ